MGYPLVNVNSLLLKMAIEIVDFPIKLYMLVYQRVDQSEMQGETPFLRRKWKILFGAWMLKKKKPSYPL